MILFFEFALIFIHLTISIKFQGFQNNNRLNLIDFATAEWMSSSGAQVRTQQIDRGNFCRLRFVGLPFVQPPCFWLRCMMIGEEHGRQLNIVHSFTNKKARFINWFKKLDDYCLIIN
jgi:hypothetical protein